MRLMVVLLAIASAFSFAADNAATAPQSPTSVKLQTTESGPEAISIPRRLSYQGKLTDSLGQPVPNAEYDLAFKLYTVSSGGTAFWTETQTVRTSAGLFSIRLGERNAIASVPDAGNLYLGMAVEGGAEMTPRVKILSVAYAYKADTANYALASPAGGDNAWERLATDSILQTVHELGISRGHAGNSQYGSGIYTHVNLGGASRTGTSGQNRLYCTVGGGSENAAGGSYSTVGGGVANTVAAGSAVIGGGNSNSVGADYGAVLGGELNAVTGEWSAIGGGYENDVSGNYSTVAGGDGNSVRDNYSNVAGGGSNDIAGSYSAIPGGRDNYVYGDFSFAFGDSVSIVQPLTAGFFDASRHGYLLINREIHTGDVTVIEAGTDVNNGNGALLTNTGIWWDVAKRADWLQSKLVADGDVLGQLDGLDIGLRDYENGSECIAPDGDEFARALGLKPMDGRIASLNVASVALAAIKELNRKLAAQQAEIEALRAELKVR